MRRGNPFRQKLEQMQQRVGEDGRLYVYVDTSTLGLDLSVDASKAEVMERYIARLEHQLEEADERDRENRRIIAMLTSRIPAIEAPESPVPTPLPRTAKTLKRPLSAPGGGSGREGRTRDRPSLCAVTNISNYKTGRSRRPRARRAPPRTRTIREGVWVGGILRKFGGSKSQRLVTKPRHGCS
jgi:hypothetical protein